MATLWIHGGFPVVRVLSELIFGDVSTTSSRGKRCFSGVFRLEYKGFLLVFQAANPKMGLGHSWGESRENISGLWKWFYHGKWLVWRWLGHQHLGLTMIDEPSKSIIGRPSPGPAWQSRASMAKHQRYATPGVDIMFNCIVYTKLNLRMVCHVVIWFHIESVCYIFVRFCGYVMDQKTYVRLAFLLHFLYPFAKWKWPPAAVKPSSYGPFPVANCNVSTPPRAQPQSRSTSAMPSLQGPRGPRWLMRFCWLHGGHYCNYTW